MFGYGKAWYYVLGQAWQWAYIWGHTGIHTLGHTIRVCEGGGGERPGEGDKVVGMQLHAYIRT